MIKIQTLITSLFFFFQMNLLFGETWSTSVDLSLSGKNSRVPRVAINDLGQTVAIWERWKDAKVATMTFGGSWSSSVQLKSGLGETSFAPIVKINNSGEVLAVWGGEYDVAPYGGVFFSTLLFGQNWSDSMAVYLGQLDIDAQLAFNNRGEAITLIDDDIIPIEVKALKLSFGGFWSEPWIISEEGDESKKSQVAMNDNGQIVVAWEAKEESGESSIHGLFSIFLGRWPSVYPLSGMHFSAAGQNAEAPQVALNLLGQTVVVWQRYDGSNWIIQAKTATVGGSWSTTVDLSLSTKNAKKSHVAMNDAGQIVSVWRKNNGTNEIIQASMMTFGGSWSTPVDLSTGGQNAENPYVVINNSGQAVAVWERSNGTNDVIQASTCIFGQSWSIPVDLSTDGQNARTPQVTLNAGGQAVAVWTRSNGVNNIIQASSTSLLPLPPVNLSGSQIPKGSMSSVTSYYNRITWEASSTDNVAYYNVYRNGVLVSSVSNDISIFMYEDWNQSQGVSVNYAVSAVSSGGGESDQVTIAIP